MLKILLIKRLGTLSRTHRGSFSYMSTDTVTSTAHVINLKKENGKHIFNFSFTFDVILFVKHVYSSHDFYCTVTQTVAPLFYFQFLS